MPDVNTILSSVGVSTLLSAALVFLARNWISERIKNAIKHEYDEKLETHKAKLKIESDKEIEQLKTRLQIAAAERSIRLTRVFEKTAETVATIYAKLQALKTATENYTQLLEPSDDPQRLELGKLVREKLADFREFYVPRQIYIPKTTQVKIAQFYNHLDYLARRFAYSLKADAKNRNIDKWVVTFTELHDQIPELLTSLEDDFQKILALEGMEPKKEARA